MRIRSFQFSDPHRSKFELELIQFNPRVNLLVGPSGVGKTRVLNMLFNIARMAITDGMITPGIWEIAFEHDGEEFLWEFDGSPTDQFQDKSSVKINSETLWRGFERLSENILFERNGSVVKFGGQDVPKVSESSSCISIYREEESVKKAFLGMSRIMRRSFFGDALQKSASVSAYPYQLLERLKGSKNNKIEELFGYEANLNVMLFILHEYFPKIYSNILEQYQIVFPFVENFVIGVAAKSLPGAFAMDAPLVMIKERGVDKGTPLHDISSGMLKVLLIITDVLCTPKDSIYMIDEYENSLGANAINFLPSFLAEFGVSRQFLITTHHPLLINELPIEDWLVFYRAGSHIAVTKGASLVEKYGKSKQEKFIQLLNDPLYSMQ